MADHDATTRRRALAILGSSLIAAPLAFASRPAAAQTAPQAAPPASRTAVDLNLVLAVDASGSVNATRFALQKQGYVDAFLNKRVLDAIGSGQHGAIAVMMFQWTGPQLHADVVPWMRVGDAGSAKRLSAAIAESDRQLFGGGTSISGAIDHSLLKFGECPFAGGRRVIDVSGDGYNNRGRPAPDARDAAVKSGVNINGLPILEIEPDLDTYYRESVIGGTNAFVVAAATFKDFGDAILRKLILEIADRTPEVPAPLPT